MACLRKDLFSTINQCGPLTFFVTFNNPKGKWEILLCFLCQLKTIHLPNGLASLDLKDNIVELVRKDLGRVLNIMIIECNAFINIWNLIIHYLIVVDYIFVTKFQSQGCSEHDCVLLGGGGDISKKIHE